MILGQLIQTGRQFCECRSQDFIPESEDTIVVIAYSIHDEFSAHSFDLGIHSLKQRIRHWLFQQQALAYILIRREPRNLQTELPCPIGRKPMDRIAFTAATEDEFETASFYLEETAALNAYRLIRARPEPPRREIEYRNLFQPDRQPDRETTVPFLPDFADNSA